MSKFNAILKGNIAKKLKISYIIIVAAMTICILFSVGILLKIRGDYESCIKSSGYSQGYVGQLGIEYNSMITKVRNVILEENGSDINTFIEEINTNEENIENYLNIIRSLSLEDREFQLLDKIETSLEAYNQVKDEVISLAKVGKDEEAYILLDSEGVEKGKSISTDILQLLNINITQFQGTMQSAQVQSLVFIIIILIMLCICIFIGIRLAVFMSNSIVKPLEEVKDAAEKLKNGNLDIEINFDSDDEIGSLAKSFRATCSTLRKIIYDLGYLLGELAQGNFTTTLNDKSAYVGEFEKIIVNIRNLRDRMSETLFNIQQIADQVSNGADQMSISAQNLAEGSTEQAGAVEELVATVENVNSMINKNAENAKESYEQTKSVAIEAKESQQVMLELSEAMTSINETSKKIGNIIAEIEDIASQTNLLSLNATIEAARAGEAGKGFAVVADQISKLATESSQSAVNTRELIESSMMEIQKGNQLTEKTFAVLNHVISRINEIGENAKQNKESAIEQADAVSQISNGIEQISLVVQTNSATAQENSATSEELSAQSESLSSETKKFKLKNKV